MEDPSSDWRSKLQPRVRERVVDKITDALRRQLTFEPEDDTELKKTAVQFEEMIYAVAVSQTDYLTKIFSKLLSLETKTEQNTPMTEQNTPMNPQTGVNQDSTDTASMHSTSQTGHNGADWQEEIYLKIQALREAHFAELQEIHLMISQLYQQNEMLPNAKQCENFENLKSFIVLLERMLAFLQISKSGITVNVKEKLPFCEKQITRLINTNRRRRLIPVQQQGQLQLQHPVGHPQFAPQHQPSQVLLVQQHENHGNQVHQLNLPGSITTMQLAMTSCMQHGSMALPTLAAPAAQLNAANSVQSASELDLVQMNYFGSLQQGSVGSVQQSGVGPLQNSISAARQTNLYNLSQSSQSGLQPNATSMQNSNVLQQQEYLIHNQQLKLQLQQRQIQHLQQLLQQQRQQMLQPLQPLQQQRAVKIAYDASRTTQAVESEDEDATSDETDDEDDANLHLRARRSG